MQDEPANKKSIVVLTSAKKLKWLVLVSTLLVMAIAIKSLGLHTNLGNELTNNSALSLPDDSQRSPILNSTDVRIYKNELYSFSYPSSFTLDSRMVITDHRTDGLGKDLFGTSEILLRSTQTSALLSVESLPNWRRLSQGDSLAAEYSSLMASKQPEDVLEKISLNGLPALHLFLRAYDDGSNFRVGTNEIIAPTDNFIFTLTLNWYDTEGNSSTAADQEAFDTIFETFTILDQ